MSSERLRTLVPTALAGLLLSVPVAADDFDALGGFGEDEEEFSVDPEEELGPQDEEPTDDAEAAAGWDQRVP